MITKNEAHVVSLALRPAKQGALTRISRRVQKGAAFTEYLVLVAIVALGCIGIATSLKSDLGGVADKIGGILGSMF